MSEEPSARRAALVAFALGAVVAIVGFGPSYVLGTSAFWSYPPTDFSSHVIGWREYLADGWRWPVFVAKTLDQPDGLNILYMDCLPILALVAKAAGPVVPSFLRTLYLNPFGAWHVLSYGLQGLFGALVMRSMGQRSLVASTSAAAVAVSMPIFVLRFYHTALNSHFFVLAALWLYLETRRDLPLGKAAARWTALLVLVLLVHPYLFAMCAAIFAATIATLAIARRFREAAVVGATAAVAVALVFLLAGFGGAPTVHGGAWGYGYKSTDLSSFLVPQYSTFVPVRIPGLAIDMARTEAAEGYDYLGLGVIAMLAVLAFAAPRALVRPLRAHAPLAVVLVLLALFAVSNRPTFAGHLLFEAPIPKAFEWIVLQFRSNGRFVWPITYAGALYLLALAFRTFRGRRAALIPPLFAAVQLVDGVGNFAYVRAFTADPAPRFLDWSVLEPIVAEHHGITFGPAFECVDWTRPIVAYAQLELEYMAARHGVGLSSLRSSRPLRDCMTDHAARAGRPVERDRLYVLFTPDVLAAETLRYERQGGRCGRFSEGILCSTRFAAGLPPGIEPLPERAAYELGTTVTFGAHGTEAPFLGPGWSYPEGDHRWTFGSRGAFLYLRTSAPVSAGAHLRLVAGGAVSAARPKTRVSVRVNGLDAGGFDLVAIQAKPFDLPLPDGLAGARILEIQLTVDDVRPPKELEGGDERPLGLSLLSLSLGP